MCVDTSIWTTEPSFSLHDWNTWELGVKVGKTVRLTHLAIQGKMGQVNLVQINLLCNLTLFLFCFHYHTYPYISHICYYSTTTLLIETCVSCVSGFSHLASYSTPCGNASQYTVPWKCVSNIYWRHTLPSKKSHTLYNFVVLEICHRFFHKGTNDVNCGLLPK